MSNVISVSGVSYFLLSWRPSPYTEINKTVSLLFEKKEFPDFIDITDMTISKAEANVYYQLADLGSILKPILI